MAFLEEQAGVGFAASPPSQQLKEGGKLSCSGSLDPPHSICVSVLSNWVGLMPWQDFLLQTAVLHAVILQQGLDGVQMDLLSCFPSCQPRAEAGQPCFPSRNISRGRLSISVMTQPCVGLLFPLLNQCSKEYIKNQHFKFLWELIAIKKNTQSLSKSFFLWTYSSRAGVSNLCSSSLEHSWRQISSGGSGETVLRGGAREGGVGVGPGGVFGVDFHPYTSPEWSFARGSHFG